MVVFKIIGKDFIIIVFLILMAEIKKELQKLKKLVSFKKSAQELKDEAKFGWE